MTTAHRLLSISTACAANSGAPEAPGGFCSSTFSTRSTKLGSNLTEVAPLITSSRPVAALTSAGKAVLDEFLRREDGQRTDGNDNDCKDADNDKSNAVHDTARSKKLGYRSPSVIRQRRNINMAGRASGAGLWNITD